MITNTFRRRDMHHHTVALHAETIRLAPQSTKAMQMHTAIFRLPRQVTGFFTWLLTAVTRASCMHELEQREVGTAQHFLETMKQ